MKKILLILFTIHCSLFAFAQPGWVKKATKSVFTLKTFDESGALIASSNGFFTGAQGEAVSSFAPFKGAVRAIIIDAQGKELEVTGMMGANEMYDVAKFRVAGKTQPLTVAAAIAPTGSNAWLLPYREMKKVPSGIVRKAETFLNDYAYYTIAMQAPELAVSCPLLNDNGEVIGIIQPSASSKDSLSYAVSARFADSLKVNGLSLNDPALRQTRIPIEIPDNINDANLMVYMASGIDSAAYIRLVDEFIRKFPKASDGYTYRAQFAAAHADFAEADRYIQQALKVADKKDEVLFSYARMIYNKNVYQNNVTYDAWTLDKALETTREASRLNPSPAYKQLEANILYASKRYDEAYDIYTDLARNSNLSAAEMWFFASSCKQQQKDTLARLALLDSAVSTFSKPYLKEAAPYLWTRAEARMDAGKYREAISDMNEYEQLMAAEVNARFYYIRHQAEIEGHLYQQALNDIERAITMEPKETVYYAEKASLEIRVGRYDEAMATAKESIAIAPDNSDGYLFLGLAQCLKGNKKEGIPNLQKARELGDPQADGLIEKYK
jgi:tetratricopeptide (TPR) repeat protein